MSKEELYKALKIFNKEDLTYENDKFFNDFEEYMNTMKQEKAIEVFMSTKDMIKYSKLEQEIDKLVDTNEDINREFSQYKYESKKEIERLNNIIKTKDEGIKAFTEDLCEESTKIEKAIEYIEKKKQERERTNKYAYDIRNDDFIKYCNIELDILKGEDKE